MIASIKEVANNARRVDKELAQRKDVAANFAAKRMDKKFRIIFEEG